MASGSRRRRGPCAPSRRLASARCRCRRYGVRASVLRDWRWRQTRTGPDSRAAAREIPIAGRAVGGPLVSACRRFGHATDWPCSTITHGRPGRQPRFASGPAIRYDALAAPVAQLDRALPSEGKGHRFESCRVRQLNQQFSTLALRANRLAAIPQQSIAAHSILEVRPAHPRRPHRNPLMPNCSRRQPNKQRIVSTISPVRSVRDLPGRSTLGSPLGPSSDRGG